MMKSCTVLDDWLWDVRGQRDGTQGRGCVLEGRENGLGDAGVQCVL